jgi:hypothetical protein
MIMNLKVQVKESKRVEETYKRQLEEKQCLKAKLLAQRKESKKTKQILTSHIKERSEDLKNLQA